MAKMARDQSILAASNRLFLRQGYESTTMRQIADEAGVSLGLATYHFKTKRMLAIKIASTYLLYLRDVVDEAVSPRKEPLLHSAVLVRLVIEFFSQPVMRRFYLECLSNDVYAQSIQRFGMRDIITKGEWLQGSTSPDLLLLFDNYIPPNVEKILFLEKEHGAFPGIAYDDIPNIVFSVSVERHLDAAAIDELCAAARPIAQGIRAAIPECITEKLFLPDED